MSFLGRGKRVEKHRAWVLLGELDQVQGPKQSKLGKGRDIKSTFLLLLILSYVLLSLMPRAKMNDLGDAMTQLTLLGDLSVYE